MLVEEVFAATTADFGKVKGKEKGKEQGKEQGKGKSKGKSSFDEVEAEVVVLTLQQSLLAYCGPVVLGNTTALSFRFSHIAMQQQLAAEFIW